MIIILWNRMIVIIIIGTWSSSSWRSYSLRIGKNVALLLIKLLRWLLLILNSWCRQNTLIYNHPSFIAPVFVQIVASWIRIKDRWVRIYRIIFIVWILRCLHLLILWSCLRLLLSLLIILWLLLYHWRVIVSVLHYALFWFHKSGNRVLIIIHLLLNKFRVWRGGRLLLNLLLLL